jgi:DNA-binding NarL/FixJ family response regulator
MKNHQNRPLTKASRPISIFICDEQPLIRTGLRKLLEGEPDIEVEAEFDNGHNALDAVRRLHPRVVLTDVSLPGLNGVELAQHLSSSYLEKPVPVVVLFSTKNDEAMLPAVRAGARGLLIKTDPTTHLVRAIRAVAAGDAVLSPPIAGRLLDRIASRLPILDTNPPAMLSRLTNRELEVLHLIARGQTNTQIASLLSIHDTTVKSHVHHVLQKLSLRDRTQAVVLAYETGLVRPVPAV